jgi:hypothetical protein
MCLVPEYGELAKPIPHSCAKNRAGCGIMGGHDSNTQPVIEALCHGALVEALAFAATLTVSTRGDRQSFSIRSDGDIRVSLNLAR